MKKATATLLAAVIAFTASVPPSHAQFTTMGSEPAGVKWSSIKTQKYRIIYPEGLDSLARVYAVLLEQVAHPVGNTAGYYPNQAYSARMPVIIHPYSSVSNGQVTWAPRRLELLTTPSSDAPEATPWERQLAIHESRHVAQMQFGAVRPFRWANVLLGELTPGGLSGIYCGRGFFEGDAVVAETALTRAGRGRTADFLEYFRVSFGEGDFRNYRRWYYGSQRWYTPDFYSAGYLKIGGMRALYDAPDLVNGYYRLIRDRGIALSVYSSNLKRYAPGKSQKEAFREVSEYLESEWREDEMRRGPFAASETVSPVPDRYREYNSLMFADGQLWAVSKGLTRAPSLVRIDPSDGKEISVIPFAASSSRPRYSAATGRIVWSEQRPDIRYPMLSYSEIRFRDGSGRNGTLTHRSRFFNPCPSQRYSLIAAVEYPVRGGSNVVVIDASDGSVLRRISAPDGMQAVELAWTGESIYASGISAEGFGIYEATGGFRCVLEPQPVKIKDLWDHDGRIMFTSDLNGVNELYSLSPEDGKLLRITNNRHGASEFAFNEAGDSLYFSSPLPEGRLVRKIAVCCLNPCEADFSQTHSYPIADKLSAGEPEQIDFGAEVEVSGPERYSKALHLLKFHSWMPFYFDTDAIQNLSFDTIYSSVGLGATILTQNDLGNAYGMLGYRAERTDGVWRHTAHAKFTYTGFYPVIEANLDFNGRDALRYSSKEDSGTSKLTGTSAGKPYISAGLRTYIPFNFTSGGWIRGLVPSVTYAASNDRFGTAPLGRLSASLRAYSMMRIPSSRVYPKFGIGAELGYAARPWVYDSFNDNLYAYIYGYLPGLWQTQGLKVSALAQKVGTHGTYSEAFAATAPRGFRGVNSPLAIFDRQMKLTADYIIPFAGVDWSVLSPVIYLRNLELILHSDLSLYARDSRRENLCSAGADLLFRIENLYGARIGVSWNYCLGSLVSSPDNRFDLVFNISL